MGVAKTAVTMSLFMFLFFSIRQEYADAKLRKLNNFAPRPYDYLIGLMEGQVTFNRARIEEYEHYYKMLIAYIPQRADAYGMMGFCAYHLGKIQEAIFYYQEAVRLNPHFFWFHYSLGVSYFNSGMYDKAGESFVNARSVDPSITYKFLFSSKVYQPILADLSDPASLPVNFKNGLKNCYLLEAAMQQKTKEETFLPKDKFYPRIF